LPAQPLVSVPVIVDGVKLKGTNIGSFFDGSMIIYSDDGTHSLTIDFNITSGITYDSVSWYSNLTYIGA
jgi:hypothetical protein